MDAEIKIRSNFVRYYEHAKMATQMTHLKNAHNKCKILKKKKNPD